MVKQTAGRDQLGEFAPKFAQLNDDVLFGEVWSREDKLSLRDRSLVTVTALMAQGLVDSSFKFHLMSAKKNGITQEEIAEILTHAAFYAGWPTAWAAFRMATEVWTDEDKYRKNPNPGNWVRIFCYVGNCSISAAHADAFVFSNFVRSKSGFTLLLCVTDDCAPYTVFLNISPHRSGGTRRQDSYSENDAQNTRPPAGPAHRKNAKNLHI